MLNSKLQTASNAKIDERFYPKQIYNLDADKTQYLLNLGMYIFYMINIEFLLILPYTFMADERTLKTVLFLF